MSYDWFPFSVADYRADTKHLTAEQDGIYRRLIDEYMFERKPLMDNDIALARIAGVDISSWCLAAATLRPYFYSENGTLKHKRCEEELQKQVEFSLKASEKGKKGAAAKKRKYTEKQRNSSSSLATAIAPAEPHQTPDTFLRKKNPLPPKLSTARKEGGVFKNNMEGMGFRIDHHLSDGAREEARKRAQGWDLHHLMAVYDKNISDGMERPRYPNKAFPMWCGSYTKGKPPN